MFEKQARIGLVLYLYYNRDVKKFLKYGDVVYHSKKMRYLLIYVDKEQSDEIMKALKEHKDIKAVKFSYLEQIDQQFVGSLNSLKN